MPEAFILDGLRPPVGRCGAILADQRPDDVVATTLKAVGVGQGSALLLERA